MRLASHPGRLLLAPFAHHYRKRYAGRVRAPRLVFALDLFFAGVVIGLLSVGVAFTFFRPRDFGDGVVFSADVAPHDVETGASSTLVIRYRNETGEDLHRAQLTLGFPAHFLLQDLSVNLAETSGRNAYDLGTVAAGAQGDIKIKGVMFGDVGAPQTFRSLLTFVHGAHDEPDQKIDFHSFTPTRSALELSLDVPPALYAGETMTGTVTARNGGPVDMPDIALEPSWPAGFTLADASIPLRGGDVHMPGLAPGASGTWSFRGTLGAQAGTADFSFRPSFAFGDQTYRQETLAASRAVAEPPLHVGHTVTGMAAGATAVATVSYENTGSQAVTDAVIGVETDSPLFPKRTYFVSYAQHPALARIAPGASGTLSIPLPAAASIQASDLAPDGSFSVVTHAYAAYGLAPGRVALESRGADVRTVPTTPFQIAASARYAAPSGDQIGLGPLPPVVGQETTYWIFWNVRGTINAVDTLRVEGRLAPGVRFTGRQTVSQGEGVAFDAATDTVRWEPGTAAPTLPPDSRAVGAAFEVALTPTPAQAGTAPALMERTAATGVDVATGDIVAAGARPVTTNLPDDPMAAGFARVVLP